MTAVVIVALGGLLLMATTWSKQRLMTPLLDLLEEGQILTSWMASSSEVYGTLEGRTVSIENVGIARGVLVVSMEQGSPWRAEIYRRGWLRSALGRLGGLSTGSQLEMDGEFLVRWNPTTSAEDAERARRQSVAWLADHPELDQLRVVTGRVVGFQVGYRRREVTPAVVEGLLRDLLDLARILELESPKGP